MLETIIAAAAIITILAGSTAYLIRAKKRNPGCVGCPHCKQCSGKCSSVKHNNN